MAEKTIRIGGMTCVHCQNRIEKALKDTAGVDSARVSYNDGTAFVTWNDSLVTLHEIKAVIKKLDYEVPEDAEQISAGASGRTELAGTLLIIFALYMLLRHTGVGAAALPEAPAGTGYGMLFVIGLITSLHCVAMCGGINLSQCLGPRGGAKFAPSALYNAGRVISYTVVGVIVGALGAGISVTDRARGAVQLAAGVFMVIAGVNMLGIFPGLRRFMPRLPKVFAKKIDEQKMSGKSPFVIGLLNGLMPCGPLQTMQIYALSTGSPVAGGISMFLFSMGTVPLMFGLGALSSALSGAKGRAFSKRALKAGAVLVTVTGMMMLTYGAGLAGLNFNGPGVSSASAADMPAIEDGVQIVNSDLRPGRYPAITVRRGIPVRWTINAPQGSINGCNNRMIIREYKIEHGFTPGKNVIEFMPEKSGRFSYSCWMGMIRSSITVAEEGGNVPEAEAAGVKSAGVSIPTEKVVLAVTDGAVQRVTVNLRDDGIDPAIIVVRRGFPAELTINNDSADPGNSRLIFPAYYTRLDMERGKNVLRLLPSETFDFSTGDNMLYGYVKVVDDPDNVDIDAVKSEAENFEPMIYPDDYFESAVSGSCCGM